MLDPSPRNPISWRSVFLGFFGVILISIITPYNDFVLANTYVIGNNLPLMAMLMFFVIAAGINGPLSRFAPRYALTSGELGVAFSMVLVGCAIPSSALMRYLPPSLVYPFWQARSDAEILKLLESLKMARWLYPDFQGSGPAQWMNDPVVTGYAGRWTGEGWPPYTAWIRPMFAWGIYVALLYGAFMFLFAILRRQWYENERLPFPLATIQLALVEAPAPRKWWNSTMSKPAFWVCFGAFFIIHCWNAMYVYWPKYYPEIPLKFDLSGIFTEEPWRYADSEFKAAYFYLTAVGVAYFLPGGVSFSMWFCFVAWQIWKMMMGMATGNPETPGQNDQMFGGLTAYVFIVLWIGRSHWAMVLRQALRGAKGNEPQGRYLAYRTAFWGFVGCVAGMVAWMTLAGVSFGGSIVLTLTVVGGLFIVARIVAESGLLQPGATFFPTRNWTLLGYLGWQRPTTIETMYFSGHMETLHHDVRESWGVYGTHAIKITDNTVFAGESMASDSASTRRLGRKLILLFASVLVVGYVTSFSSMLWTEYEFAVQKKPDAKVVNEYAGAWAITGHWMNPTLDYVNNRYNMVHSPPKHFAIGAGITVFLAVMRLRYPWWPVHPVGFLCVGSWPLGQLWFAFFLGWLARTVALKWGGTKLYMGLRPAMIGIIIGEAAAAGFWMVTGIVLSTMGMTYKPVKILPD